MQRTYNSQNTFQKEEYTAWFQYLLKICSNQDIVVFVQGETYRSIKQNRGSRNRQTH